MRDLTLEQVSSLLRHDPSTGKLYWRTRPRSMFDSTRSCSWWNARFAEKEAFTSPNREGYRRGTILGKTLAAHRVIWLLETGEWPDVVDHINGVKDDNRFVNLRSVSHAENCRNQKLAINNTSGVAGVSWHKPLSKWRVQASENGKKKHVGYYDDFASAAKVAKARNGFHENHGRRDQQAGADQTRVSRQADVGIPASANNRG